MNVSSRKIICLFALTFLISVGFTSITSGQNYPYPGSWDTLTVTINLSGAGTVTPGSGQYAYGDTIVVYETTNVGYSFNGWYLNGVYEGQLSSIPLTMTQDYNLEAVFSVQQVALTITANPSNGGTIAPGIGIWNYTSGDSVIVRESPNPGFTFSGWYLDGTYEGAGTGITVSMVTDHQLDAFFAGSSSSPTPQPTQTATPTPTPQPTPSYLPSPSLSFYCTSSTTISGFNVEIQGLLSYNRTGLSGAGILFAYSVTNGATWQDLAYVTTSDDGSFSCVWMPNVSGDYVVKATWPGDSVYSSVSTTVNFAVAPFNNQVQNVFSVTSNTTLASLAFDSTQDQLSFSVSGPSGTIGYAQVCIPKSLMADTSELAVTVDDQAVPYATFSQSNVWLITIHYHCSTHAVVMSLNSSFVATSTSTPTTTSTSTATAFENLLGGQLIFIGIIAVLVVVIAVLIILNRRKRG